MLCPTPTTLCSFGYQRVCINQFLLSALALTPPITVVFFSTLLMQINAPNFLPLKSLNGRITLKSSKTSKTRTTKILPKCILMFSYRIQNCVFFNDSYHLLLC